MVQYYCTVLYSICKISYRWVDKRWVLVGIWAIILQRYCMRDICDNCTVLATYCAVFSRIPIENWYINVDIAGTSITGGDGSTIMEHTSMITV